MLKFMKRVARLALAIALVGLSATQVSAKEYTGDKTTLSTGTEITRIGGQDRYETAVKISESTTFDSKTAILASGENFPDAVCSAALAKTTNAPVLLTEATSIPANTLAELKKLGITTVYILGGKGVVSENIESQLKDIGVTTINRLGGQDRYETSVQLAKYATGVDSENSTVFIVNSDSYTDALSVAPIAGMYKFPILLTEQGVLSDSVKAYLSQHPNIVNTYVMGGTDLVSDSVVSQLPGKVQRILGRDKYTRNATIVEDFCVNAQVAKSPMDRTRLFVASGEGFADALGITSLAGREGNPIILVNADNLSGDIRRVVPEIINDVDENYVIGQQGSVSDKGLTNLYATIDNSTSVGATGANVTKKVTEIVASIIKPEMTDVQKEFAIFDYLTKNVKYDNTLKIAASYKAEGAILDNLAVCQGYAEAFQLLGKKAGLVVEIRQGHNGSAGHAWNVVKLDNDWYNVDTTFSASWYADCESNKSMTDISYYRYFNFTDVQRNLDGISFDKSIMYKGLSLPIDCSATKLDYDNYIALYPKQ